MFIKGICISKWLSLDEFRFTAEEEASPLHRVFLKEAREERAGLGAQCAREADVFHEDELEQLLVILVVERQSSAHHLIHHHSQTPPVHRTAIVIVFQHLGQK